MSRRTIRLTGHICRAQPDKAKRNQVIYNKKKVEVA
jgi:hypothetical protein